MIRSIFIASLLLATTAFGQQEAQPTLPITSLTVKDKSIAAEVADDNKERMTGLMFRKKLEPDSGMLFVMPRVEHASFWMRNTLIPLSVAYISPEGEILEIHDMKPLDESPIPSHFNNIAYALEMDQGWFSKNGILPSDRLVGLPRGPK
ncbi:DUF192 domain-containing protein [soil metagenome]